MVDKLEDSWYFRKFLDLGQLVICRSCTLVSSGKPYCCIETFIVDREFHFWTCDIVQSWLRLEQIDRFRDFLPV